MNWKPWTALVAVVALTGCMWQDVDRNDIDTAIKACGSLENIVSISAGWHGDETTICADRRKHHLNYEVWKPHDR